MLQVNRSVVITHVPKSTCPIKLRLPARVRPLPGEQELHKIAHLHLLHLRQLVDHLINGLAEFLHWSAIISCQPLRFSSLSSQRERIKPCVAENPKRHDHGKQHPDISRVHLMLLKWTTAYGRCRVTQECIQQKRKRHDHERIKLESCDYVAVHQAMKPARAAATRTVESRERAKRASRKEPSLARIENEEIGGPNRN